MHILKKKSTNLIFLNIENVQFYSCVSKFCGVKLSTTTPSYSRCFLKIVFELLLIHSYTPGTSKNPVCYVYPAFQYLVLWATNRY